MKIAFFCDAYHPTRSGVAVSAGSTAEELRARGHEVTIYAPRYTADRDDNPEREIPGVVYFAAGHWYLAKDFPVAWPGLSRANVFAEARFHRERYDLVHSHSPFILGTVGARWAKHAGIPTVFTFHTLYHRYLHYVPAPSAWTRSWIVAWVRHYCWLCNHIIAPSRAVSQIVGALQPRTPRSVIPTGIDVEHFQGGDGAAIRARFGVAEGDTVLLYVGRIVREKNLVFLLRALAPLLKEENSRVHLLMVGGGMFEEEMHAMTAQMGIASRVHCTSFVAPDEVRNYYAAADVFTFASRTETQGLTIAESLAAGVPPVVVGAMGAAESVEDGHTGFVVAPREEAFRAAVKRLIDEPETRKRMSQAAREYAPRLSRAHSTDALVELYESLLKPAK
ncbi:MAG TPA: glycosyltransferase [Abditibacteriaceae bacterium]|jgi:glycosyltransferase involved in cell wall biosynthesis